MFFKTNHCKKEDLEVIKNLRQKIFELEEIILHLRENFMKDFKQKWDHMKDHPKYKHQYEAKYSCLFGNGINL